MGAANAGDLGSCKANCQLILEITGALKGYTLLFARSLGSQVIEETNINEED
jgi:hypothetical protein